ncbi:hypothetical protein NBRC116599_30840 [Aquicoccus sp. SU-CL01552]
MRSGNTACWRGALTQEKAPAIESFEAKAAVERPGLQARTPPPWPLWGRALQTQDMVSAPPLGRIFRAC